MKLLDYDRSIVPQTTGWYCGPASIQVVLDSLGIKVPEPEIARQTEALEGNHGWDDQDGTDHIGQIRTVLNRYKPEGKYAVIELRQDPPTKGQRDKLWDDIVASVNAGYGVVANIVSPPSNRPRAVSPSTVSPNYGWSTIYHYVPIMGWRVDAGARKVWVADTGFSPYGYWITLDNLATLIPPKGYCYSTAKASAPSVPANPKAPSSFTEDVRAQLTGSLDLGKYVGYPQLGGRTVVDAIAAILEKLGVK